MLLVYVVFHSQLCYHSFSGETQDFKNEVLVKLSPPSSLGLTHTSLSSVVQPLPVIHHVNINQLLVRLVAEAVYSSHHTMYNVFKIIFPLNVSSVNQC